MLNALKLIPADHGCPPVGNTAQRLHPPILVVDRVHLVLQGYFAFWALLYIERTNLLVLAIHELMHAPLLLRQA